MLFTGLWVNQDKFNSLLFYTPTIDNKSESAKRLSVLKHKGRVQIIDAKRAMNGGIMLAKMKLEFLVATRFVTNM